MKHFAVVAVVGLGVLMATMGARGWPAGEIALDETRLSQTPAPAPTRRSERIRMPELIVASPDGTVRVTLLANAERLTHAVSLDGSTVLEPSPLAMHLDGYELSTGGVFNTEERYQGNETYPWRGARSTAVSAFNGARLSLTNDLTSTNYALEVRAFNDGVAYRHQIPGEPSSSRVPDEYSTFNLPVDATAWYAGMAEGHYEAPYTRKTVAEVRAGEWAGPPLTVKLPRDGGYAAITEANLVNYSGMGLESNGRGGVGASPGHRAFHAVSRRTGGVHDDGVHRAAQGYDGGPSDRQPGDLLEPAADRPHLVPRRHERPGPALRARAADLSGNR